MAKLIFTLRCSLYQHVDVSPLIPEHLVSLSLRELSSIPLQVGNRCFQTGELFAIEKQSKEALSLIFQGAHTAKLDYVGCKMTSGDILVEGDAGSYTGMQVKGGRLVIKGSVGAYAACEMQGGQVIISKEAGDFLGSGRPGRQKGMSGGVVLVKGKVGDRAGDQMRRGTLLIEGSAGTYLGSRLIAGTIGVLGEVGEHIGYGMKRGTLLLATSPTDLPITFDDCGIHTLGFIPLLLKGFSGLGTCFSEMCDTLKRVRRYTGDLSNLGKGEILIA